MWRMDLLNFRGHLTCTNKRAQAAEQKIARNKSFLAPPAMHLLCMCSMLVPREFSHLRKRSAKKLRFCTWKLPHFREREKVAETFRQCTFSFDNLLLFLILVRVIAQEAPKTLKWPSGCAHLLVHIRRPPKISVVAGFLPRAIFAGTAQSLVLWLKDMDCTLGSAAFCTTVRFPAAQHIRFQKHLLEDLVTDLGFVEDCNRNNLSNHLVTHFGSGSHSQIDLFVNNPSGCYQGAHRSKTKDGDNSICCNWIRWKNIDWKSV